MRRASRLSFRIGAPLENGCARRQQAACAGVARPYSDSREAMPRRVSPVAVAEQSLTCLSSFKSIRLVLEAVRTHVHARGPRRISMHILCYGTKLLRIVPGQNTRHRTNFSQYNSRCFANVVTGQSFTKIELIWNSSFERDECFDLLACGYYALDVRHYSSSCSPSSRARNLCRQEG